MFQKGSLINSNLCQEVSNEHVVFFVLFPVIRNKKLDYISVKIKGSVAELSSIRSSVKDIVIDRIKRSGFKFYECTSVDDFDMKYAVYKLTDDPNSFGESHET